MTLQSRAKECASYIKKHSSALVVSHIDADGLTSAAIMGKALERAGIEYEIRFVKQLEQKVLTEVADRNPELVIFTDLGSGMLDSISSLKLNAVISDHHQPQGAYGYEYHLNPHLFAINGATEISGSGTTYFMASEMGDNVDLACLAIVGAVGDLQHVKHGQLIGANRSILDEGVKSGVLHYENDLMLFGKQTRPVFKLLQYSSDPYLPGITGSEDASIEFLKRVGIRQHGEKWRRWIDLEPGEKQQIVSALIQFCLTCGVPGYRAQRLVGEVYTLLCEREGTETRDASEYSTLLNATARYDHADIGLAVCMGDRAGYFEEACALLNEHRRNLVEGLNLVKEQGLTQMEHLQYFDAGDKIRETIVGIVAGMCTSFVNNRDLPIIAFADSDGGVKVSSRGNYDLTRKGLNLGEAISQAARAVGGTGGGHDIAAGAFIPSGSKDEFIRVLDHIVGSQIKTGI
ncbi:single-stranded DNA-specific exonuclease [Candidatus Methanoperedens nitroreducens]|uniref:Single-stranded DNA-specific exonuclease n=1 Tax=Candidatus Methanoperedens nitratireducens TaxID=1392998 RepID=A0A062V9G3_9EURY|nr:DHH family phosphoesterase [Candidatus Methanoperedens nitroreducens]KCZ73198.1 single-stranded DNA-specific exonuclease [Candidatus Methanoperedens nitroreducens]MDJ1422853.1 DHH family phosphoesterase [Candidatus Methanoperedens sp.]